jgi:hypothetical protein
MMEEHHRSMLESIERLMKDQDLHGRVSRCSRGSHGSQRIWHPEGQQATESAVTSVWKQSRKPCRVISDGDSVRMRHTESARTAEGLLKQNVSVHDAKTRLSRIKSMVIEGAGSHSSLSEAAPQRACPCVVAGAIRDRREFEAVVTAVILASTVSVGFHADWSIKHPGMDLPEGSKVLDRCFLCAFALELLIRVLAEGLAFFHVRSPCFGWNVFDTCIVIVSFLNEVNPLSLNLSMMRAVRPLRLVKVLRVFRFLSWFRELRIMVSGILNCGRTLCWSVLLLTVISYIYAVFCLQIFADWLGSVGDRSPESDEQIEATIDSLNFNFTSLPWSAYTLFKAISGGIEWGENLSDPMYQVSAAMVFSFVLYIT